MTIFCGEPASLRFAFADAFDLPVGLELQIGHLSWVDAVAFSPNGRTIVSGSLDSTLKLWDAASGRELRTLSGHTDSVRAVAFSPDGRIIVSGSADQTLKLWDAASGRELRTLSGHTDSVHAVAFSPDGQRIISGGEDKTLKLWDTASGQELQTFLGHSGRIEAVAFSPDGRTIVSASDDNTLKLWDAASGRELRTLAGHFSSTAHIIEWAVAFSPDGRTIVSGSNDHTLSLWEAASGRELRMFLGHPEAVEAVAFSPDGQTIVSGSADKTLKLWDAASGRELRTLSGHSESVDAIAFSPDGQTIISGSADKTLKLWDAASGRELRTLSGHSESVDAVAFSPDGQTVVSGGEDKTLKLWGSANGRELQSLIGHADSVYAVAFSPNGRTIVSGSADKTLKLWDAASGKELRTCLGHSDRVEAVAFSPDGRTILSGSDDGTLKLWEAASGRELRSMADSDQVKAVAFSPDGRRIVSARDILWSADGNKVPTLKLWDAASGQELRTPRLGDNNAASAVAYSPDGRTIVSGSWDNTLKLWDAVSGRELRTLSGHSSDVKAVAFSPNGSEIVSGSWDNTLKLWDAVSGRELRTLSGHSKNVRAVAFSPDGRKVASGSGDTTLKLWDVDGKLLVTMVSFDGGDWIAVTPEGFFDASEHGADQLNVVHGLDAYSIGQLKQQLYRPDLVREKLAGDPNGLVKGTAAKLNLTKVIASGSAPKVTILHPTDGANLGQAEEATIEASVADRGGGVGRVEWRVNGVTQGIEARGFVPIDALAAPTGTSAPASYSSDDRSKSLLFKRALKLDPGDNRIEIVAFNTMNLVASEPVAITVRRDTSTVGRLTKPKLHVLAIGVNKYRDSRLTLAYAASDATALADAFRKAGGGLYSDVDATTVLDGDVTIAHLDQVFADLSRRVAPGDVFVFFLAGHGKTIDGRYYFLPQDFHYRDERSIEQDGVDQDRLQRWFAEIPAKKSVLLFDTCDSGSLAGASLSARGLGELEAVQRLIWATGRTTLTASTDDAPALEGYRGHGVFTFALLASFNEAKVDQDGLIDVTALAHYVDMAVPRISETAFNLRQVPQMLIRGSDFPLARRMNVLDDAPQAAQEPAALSTKPTHVVIAPVDVFAQASATGSVLTRLAPGTQVRLVETKDGWTLIARDGKTIGYVDQKALAGLQ